MPSSRNGFRIPEEIIQLLQKTNDARSPMRANGLILQVTFGTPFYQIRLLLGILWNDGWKLRNWSKWLVNDLEKSHERTNQWTGSYRTSYTTALNSTRSPVRWQKATANGALALEASFLFLVHQPFILQPIIYYFWFSFASMVLLDCSQIQSTLVDGKWLQSLNVDISCVAWLNRVRPHRWLRQATHGHVLSSWIPSTLIGKLSYLGRPPLSRHTYHFDFSLN